MLRILIIRLVVEAVRPDREIHPSVPKWREAELKATYDLDLPIQEEIDALIDTGLLGP